MPRPLTARTLGTAPTIRETYLDFTGLSSDMKG